MRTNALKYKTYVSKPTWNKNYIMKQQTRYFFFIYTQTRVNCFVSMHNGKHFNDYSDNLHIWISHAKRLLEQILFIIIFSIRTHISNFAIHFTNHIRQYSNKFLLERRCALFADSCMFDLTSALQKRETVHKSISY